MPGSANNGSVLVLTQGSACSRDIYQDHASGLYRGCLSDPWRYGAGVGVVSDVIAESARWPRRGHAGEDDMAALLHMALLRLATSSAAVAETPEEREKDDAETRIRHGDHHGSCRSRARSDGGQVAAGCAAVRGDEEDVTRAASRSLAASRPRPAVTVTMSARER